MMESPTVHGSGRCLCGAVSYTVTAPLRAVIACHCEQCRRTSGHHVAASAAPTDALIIDDPTGALTWYRSSDFARRGFCSVCGSNLFWDRIDGPHTSIMAGTLNKPTNLTLTHHIYCAYKSDYYTLPDSLPLFHEGD
ncbi:MAG: GFA family protein [Alphaproteobacteria bacterium]|nr:GFA family protein [Alphaproteobacteria bacterium]